MRYSVGLFKASIQTLMVTLPLVVCTACNDGEIGPRGKRGPVGLKGASGDAGPAGEPGLPGPKGDAGVQGPQGQNGIRCTANAIDGGVLVSCDDGTTQRLHHGQDGQNGQNGQDGTNGQNGADGIHCFGDVSDGGTFIRCHKGPSQRIRHGVDGIDGTSCTTQTVDGGLRVSCGEGVGLMIHDGRDGLNGQQGVSGDNGNDGIGGTGCQTQETVEGVMLLCGNDTQAYLRDGADGQPGTDGLPGTPGNPGTGCTTSTVSNGQSIACANDTLTLKDNPGCTFSSTETGTTVACADLEGAITSTETIAHYAYVEPFGLGATNTQNNGNANTTYFSLVEVPVSGTYDQFVLFQGDEPNDGNYPTLEVGIFEKVEENWQLVSGSSIVTIPAPGPGVDSDLATHSFDYGYYRRSGLNASLISQTPYLFLVRISGTTWRFSAHTASASTAPFHTWTKSVNQNLENYTTTLSDSDGTRVSPWFRLSQ